MARKGLSKELIIDTAMALVEEEGYNNLSMRNLAKRLDVKAASLYNHIKSTDDLNSEICIKIADDFFQAQKASMEGKSPQEAILALANAYRNLAKEKQKFYEIVVMLPNSTNEALYEKRKSLFFIVMEAVSKFNLTEEQKLFWQRTLRATVHGFASLENAGYFTIPTINNDEMYNAAIMNIIKGMEADEKANQ